MVYVAPSKGSRGGKSGAPKNGNKGNRGRGKEQDALASKADLLVKLTRQAEEHTRILERERAALGLPSRASPNGQAPSHPFHQQQQNQQPAASNARNRRANYHVYTDQRNKKVFDPRQIPGLGGGNGDGGGGRAPAIEAPEASNAEQTFNQTFPDSPNFYPGRVFAIPGTIPPPPNQPQQSKPDDGTIIVAPWGGPPQVVVAGPPPMQGQLPWQQGQPCSPGGRGPQIMAPLPMGMGMPQSQRGGPTQMGAGPGLCESQPAQQVNGGRPSSISNGGPQFGSGMESAEMADPRVAARMEADARKEAYRRELEEQIRAKKQAKEAEERRRREEDAAWEARAAAAPQPWDPEARAARRGGGGEPLRDEYGRPVANLRQRGGGPSSPIGAGPAGLGPGLPPGMPPSQLGPGMAGPFTGPPGPAGRLTVELPNGGAGAFPGPGAGGGVIPLPFSGNVGALAPHSHGQVPGPPLTPLRLGALPPPGPPGPGAISSGGGSPFDGPPAPMLSPSHIPPVSPGNRRFMAAMNDLIAGPSDEQRRQKEMARQRLQMDLEEQIREKRERQARERAELERQRQKEEAELKAFQDNIVVQRQAEPRHAPAAAPGAGGQLSPQQQLQRRESSGGGIDAGRPPLPPRRHGKGGKIIDASWLDAPKAPPVALPPLSSPPAVPQISPGRGFLGRRPSTGMADGALPTEELAGGGQVPVTLSPGPGLIGRAASHDGASGVGGVVGGRGNVTTLLQLLQEEQSRMREDFARQAAAMEKLATDASRALADRDEAWRELQRVRSMLAGGGAAAAVPGGDDSLASCGLGTVIVDTHLVPKSTNSIPDPLPKPVASEVLRRGRSDPALSDGGMRGGLLSPVAPGGGDGFAGGFFGGGFGYGDLGPLQGPALNRNANGVHRSGIPLPPGMNPGGAAQSRLAPQRIQSVYGYGFESPPKSRYNSFFGLEQGPPASAGHIRGGGGGGGGGFGLPSLGPRKPPPLKPPPSPAILRGDHLPSPVKQTRGPQQSQPGGARARSGRPLGGGGATERPMRGRAASAAPLQSQPKSPPELPPVVPLPAAAVAATVTGPPGRLVSRRSLEGMQNVLRRGHEEKLLRGMGSDDGSGSTGTTVEYVAEDVPVTSRSDVRGRRFREPSLPGHAEMMSPGAAADYLGGSGSVAASTAAAGASGKAATRSFFSDSIASYKSLLSQRTLAAAATAATPTPVEEAGVEQAGRSLNDADSQEHRMSLSQGGSSATGTGAATPQEQDPNGSTNGGGRAGVATVMRTATAVSIVSVTDSQSSDMPVQRPVRAGRRPSAQQRLPSPADGNLPGADSRSNGNVTGTAADVIPAIAGTAADDD